MTRRAVRVTAPSRLHFGMISANPAGTRLYGSVGAMIASPGLRIVVRADDSFRATGPLADRARAVAERAAATLFGTRDPPRCCVEVLDAPPEHVGLGTGTQLSMAVAAAIAALWGLPPLDAVALARCAGRGERSAVGLYGFVHGGMLFDAGKGDPAEIAPLVERVPLPAQWRFVLVRPRDAAGLHGDQERRAFGRLPAVPEARSAELRRVAAEVLFPAAAAGDFDAFSESLYRFGYTVGLSFAEVQGGAFAGPRLTALVETIRALGVGGVSQSSWGPTLFAALPDESAADDFVRRLRQRTVGDDLEILATPPDNAGARTEVVG